MRAERAAEHLLRGARRLEQRARARCRSRCPSRAASRRRSSVAMLPVAPCGTGQPPSSPKLDSKRAHAGVERREHVRQTLAARVVEVRGQLDVRRRARRAPPGRTPRTCGRVGHAGRVAEADLLRARVDQPARDREHPLRRHVALVGAAEGDRDHALAAQALGLARAAEHALEPGQRLLDRAVHVRAVVRLGRRQEDVDLVEAVAQRAARCRARARWGSAPTARRRPARRSPRAPRARRRAAGSRRRARSS